MYMPSAQSQAQHGGGQQQMWWSTGGGGQASLVPDDGDWADYGWLRWEDWRAAGKNATMCQCSGINCICRHGESDVYWGERQNKADFPGTYGCCIHQRVNKYKDRQLCEYCGRADDYAKETNTSRPQTWADLKLMPPNAHGVPEELITICYRKYSPRCFDFDELYYRKTFESMGHYVDAPQQAPMAGQHAPGIHGRQPPMQLDMAGQHVPQFPSTPGQNVGPPPMPPNSMANWQAAMYAMQHLMSQNGGQTVYYAQ